MAKSRTAARPPALTVDLDTARRFWHERQGLAAPQQGSLAEVLARTSWGRTLGGIDVYLAVRARVPGLTRASLEQAIGDGSLQVLPCVRGCIYLLPKEHAALGLKIAEELARKRIDAETKKAGVKAGELAAVGKEVLRALKKAPLSTDGLKKALPAGTVRSLGEAGKKVGISSTLPPSLRVLEFDGAIERVPLENKLDVQDYLWRIPGQSPFSGVKLPADAAGRHAELARLFAAQAGPVTLAHFACWSGLTKTAAAAAIAKAGLAPVAVTGYADEAWALEADLPEIAKAGKSDRISFLSFEDGYLTHHGGPGVAADAKHHARPVESWGSMGKSLTLGTAGHVSTRTLLIGEKLAGYWEYDLDLQKVAFGTFEPLPAAVKTRVQKAADETAAFIRDEMGHAKSFSLDNETEIRKRLAVVTRLKG